MRSEQCGIATRQFLKWAAERACVSYITGRGESEGSATGTRERYNHSWAVADLIAFILCRPLSSSSPSFHTLTSSLFNRVVFFQPFFPVSLDYAPFILGVTVQSLAKT